MAAMLPLHQYNGRGTFPDDLALLVVVTSGHVNPVIHEQGWGESHHLVNKCVSWLLQFKDNIPQRAIARNIGFSSSTVSSILSKSSENLEKSVHVSDRVDNQY